MARRRVKAAEEAPAGVPPPRRASTPADPFLDVTKVAKGWGKARDVFRPVRAHPTIFADFNRAARVGGLPLGRVSVVYGPSAGGKSLFALGLCASFVRAGHLAAYVDAERSTPEEFATDILEDLDRYPNFGAKLPTHYEATIDEVDAFLDGVIASRARRPDLASIVVVDTINKLQPKNELAKIMKDGGEELSKGHQGRDRARMNKAWLDHLTPRLEAANCAFVAVAWEKGAGVDHRGNPTDGEPLGGDAMVYETSGHKIRVGRVGVVRDPAKDVVAVKFRARIRKSKVAPMDGNYSDSHFYVAAGTRSTHLDVARDYVAVAIELGVVDLRGAWYAFEGRRIGQGIERVIERLEKDEALLDELRAAVDARTSGGRK